MLFHENITSKEQMVGWLDKRRPAPASECNRLRRNIYKDWSNIQDFNFKPSRKADQWWRDGNLESGKGALWDADQTLHQEAVEQISKCKPWLSLIKSNKKLFQFQELDAEVFTRLPYRENRDDRLYTNHMTDVFESFAPPRYFDDPWQHLPKDGYTRMFENMLLKVGLRSWKILLKFFSFRIPRSQFGWQLTTLRWIL